MNPPAGEPAECLPVNDSVELNVIDQPSLSINPIAQICNTSAEGSLLNLNSLILTSNGDGEWSDIGNSMAVSTSFGNYDFNGVLPGTYQFLYTIPAEDPCDVVSETVSVTVEDCRVQGVWIPSAFSPNGDGQNDEFRAIGVKVKSVNLQIYDRWGQLYFEGDGYTQGWDGTFKGNKCEVAVYVYWIKVVFEDDSERLYTGNVTLLR